MISKCLNCGNATENNFCSFCGQKTSTHRFSLKHFVLHDFIHGVFHLDKGFLYTVKELFIRPGHSIREYIQGGRVKHFNYFTLLLIIISLTHFIYKYSITDDLLNKANGGFVGYSRVESEYAIFTSLSFVPLYAVASYLLFKKSKQSYLENFIFNIYLLNGMLIINCISIFIKIFIPTLEYIQYFHVLMESLKLCYFFWFYFQYFSNFGYIKKILIIKCLFMILAVIFITLIINNIINYIGLQYFS